MSAKDHHEIKIDSLNKLMEAGQDLASSTDLDELLNKIARASMDITQSARASILLVDEDKNDLYFRQTHGNHGELTELVRVPLNDHSVAGWCVQHKKHVIIDDVSKDSRHYKGVDKATGFQTKSMLAVPIRWGERNFGVIEVLNKNQGKYEELDAEYLTILAAQAAVALNNVYVVEQLQNFFVHTVELLVTALETLDPGARGHTQRVARMATAVARDLGMSGKDLEQVLYAAYFHEIGRLLQHSALAGARDKAEPVIGAQLLEKIKLLEKVAPVVRSHREKFDGSGYPDGLRGEEIPLAARILGLAVDYDEQQMRNASLAPDVFQRFFMAEAADRHDPKLLEVFERVIFSGPEPTVNENGKTATGAHA
jgi:putative nucleotidyltransferase with HDIG domain